MTLVTWIIRNQFGRRNLAPFTRVELALRLEPLVRGQAKENLKTSTGGKNPQPCQNSDKAAEKIDTKRELAERLAENLEVKAKENMQAGGKIGGTSKVKGSSKLTTPIGDTRAVAAKEAGVSTGTLTTYRMVKKNVSAETLRDWRERKAERQ